MSSGRDTLVKTLAEMLKRENVFISDSTVEKVIDTCRNFYADQLFSGTYDRDDYVKKRIPDGYILSHYGGFIG